MASKIVVYIEWRETSSSGRMPCGVKVEMLLASVTSPYVSTKDFIEIEIQHVQGV